MNEHLAAETMREACAKLVENGFESGISWSWGSIVNRTALRRVAAAIRNLPIPATLKPGEKVE